MLPEKQKSPLRYRALLDPFGSLFGLVDEFNRRYRIPRKAEAWARKPPAYSKRQIERTARQIARGSLKIANGLFVTPKPVTEAVPAKKKRAPRKKASVS